jgi:hypothetical protein
VTIAWFELLSWHLSGGTGELQKPSVWVATDPAKKWISWMQVRSTNTWAIFHSPACFFTHNTVFAFYTRHFLFLFSKGSHSWSMWSYDVSNFKFWHEIYHRTVFLSCVGSFSQSSFMYLVHVLFFLLFAIVFCLGLYPLTCFLHLIDTPQASPFCFYFQTFSVLSFPIHSMWPLCIKQDMSNLNFLNSILQCI